MTKIKNETKKKKTSTNGDDVASFITIYSGQILFSICQDYR
jgi:hypothetical protein